MIALVVIRLGFTDTIKRCLIKSGTVICRDGLGVTMVYAIRLILGKRSISCLDGIIQREERLFQNGNRVELTDILVGVVVHHDISCFCGLVLSLFGLFVNFRITEHAVFIRIAAIMLTISAFDILIADLTSPTIEIVGFLASD